MEYTSLVDYRNSKGLSQVEMARVIGCSTSYYSKIEIEVVPPSYKFLLKLKKVFPDFDLTIFFEEDKYEKFIVQKGR